MKVNTALTAVIPVLCLVAGAARCVRAPGGVLLPQLPLRFLLDGQTCLSSQRAGPAQHSGH